MRFVHVSVTNVITNDFSLKIQKSREVTLLLCYFKIRFAIGVRCQATQIYKRGRFIYYVLLLSFLIHHLLFFHRVLFLIIHNSIIMKKDLANYFAFSKTEAEIQAAKMQQQQDSQIPKFIRQISVFGQCEVSCPPDCCSFQVCIRSSKENLDDVKNSVTRRLSYIEQVVKNSEFNKETKLEVYKTFSREEKLNTLVADINLTFSNLKICDDLRNLLTEKLDSNAVDIGPVQLYHSQQSTEKLRLKASLLAIDNAKSKARVMAESINQYLGRPLMVCEEKSQEWFGLLPNSSSEKEINSSKQQQIKMATKCVKCEVHAQFELLQKDQM